MKRREFLIGAGCVAGGGLATVAMIPGHLEAGLQIAQDAIADSREPLVRINFQRDPLEAEPWAQKLISAAEDQIGVTVIYDPAYVGLSFPNGDLPRERGVCTDVVIRAYRDAFGFDLQEEVNADMKRNFKAYPKNWGLKRPDRNIDHRRVPNLRAFFERKATSLSVSDDPSGYLPGDIVSQMLPGNLAPHCDRDPLPVAGWQTTACHSQHRSGNPPRRSPVRFPDNGPLPVRTRRQQLTPRTRSGQQNPP